MRKGPLTLLNRYLYEVTHPTIKGRKTYLFGSYHTKTTSISLYQPENFDGFVKADVLLLENNFLEGCLKSLLERINPYKSYLVSIGIKNAVEFVNQIKARYEDAYHAIGDTWHLKYLRQGVYPCADKVNFQVIYLMLLYYDAYRKIGYRHEECLESYDYAIVEKAKSLNQQIKSLCFTDSLDSLSDENKDYLAQMFYLLTQGYRAEDWPNIIKALQKREGMTNKEYFERESCYTLWQCPVLALEQNEIKSLLVQKNIAWVKSLTAIMKEHSAFTIVGAGHLHGKYGMLTLLKQQGYQVIPKDCPRQCDEDEKAFDKVMLELKKTIKPTF